MPRRNAPRCPLRGSAADESLDDTVEANLTGGDCFGHWDLRSRVQFARPWARWGDEITARWRAAFPGSRPFACYILGEIAPPTWQHEWPALRRPLRKIEGCTVEITDCGWHKCVAEFEHLLALGLVDDDEHDEAIERFECRDWYDHGRYRAIATR